MEKNKSFDDILAPYILNNSECMDRGITDENKISSILDELFEIPVTEFCVTPKGNPNEVLLTTYLDACDIPESHMSDLNFGEFLLCFEHFMSDYITYESPNLYPDMNEIDMVATFSWFYLNSLKNNRLHSYTCEQLSQINIKALIRTIMERCCSYKEDFIDSDGYITLQKTMTILLDSAPRNLYTVNDFIDYFYDRVTSHWFPSDEITKYTHKVRHAYSVLYFSLYLPLLYDVLINPVAPTFDEVQIKYTKERHL